MNPGAITPASSRCGCPPIDPTAFRGPSPGKGCGCGGACGCGGGCSGACGCASGRTSGTSDATCVAGTAEATKRSGIVTGGCLAPRARFFPGELVTDADMTAAVDYHRAQQLLANGVIGGWGIYCGFSLCIDETTCTLCVGPGIAVDARGRVLVNDATICVKRPEASQVDPQTACDPCAKRPDESLYLAIVYDDCLDGAKPRYGSVCGPGPDPGCDFSRVRERGRLVWIRDIDPSYWTSGCLPDPCGDPVGPPERDCEPRFSSSDKGKDLTLDECTPCIGIRGGRGVGLYARQLDMRWALSRNVQLLTQQGNPSPECGLGIATLIDVISGAACEACGGEAVVVLGRVDFATAASGQPTIHAEPLRRRVLSNASLTYLVEWLMEYVICDRRATNARPEHDLPPPDTGTCDDPCVDAKKIVEEIALAAVGDEPEQRERFVAAESRAAWWIMVRGRRTLASFDRRAFLDVVEAAYGRPTSEQEAAALQRFYQLVGRADREDAVRRGVALLYPRGLPAARRPDVEDAVYEFLQRRRIDELGTAQAPEVIRLGDSINREILHRGAYPREQAERLRKVLPGGTPSPEAEVVMLRERVRELEQEVARIGTAVGEPAPTAGGPSGGAGKRNKDT